MSIMKTMSHRQGGALHPGEDRRLLVTRRSSTSAGKKGGHTALAHCPCPCPAAAAQK